MLAIMSFTLSIAWILLPSDNNPARSRLKTGTATHDMCHITFLNTVVIFILSKHKMESSLDMLSEASRLGQGISCSIAQEDAHHGCSHTVYKIISENSIEWAARICHDSDNWQYEIRALKLLQYIKQQRPNLRTPNVFFRDDHPVLYSEWVRGEPLAIWNHGIPAIKRETLLDDFAEFVLQLWTIPAPPDLSSTQSSSYSVWLSQSLDRGLRRTLNGTARWGDPIDYLIMRSMIPEYTVGLDKYTAIGFSHGDLNTFNVMRDEDFHLTG